MNHFAKDLLHLKRNKNLTTHKFPNSTHNATKYSLKMNYTASSGLVATIKMSTYKRNILSLLGRKHLSVHKM